MFKFEFFKEKVKPTLKDLPPKSTFILLSDMDSPYPEVFQVMSAEAEVDGLAHCNVYSLNNGVACWRPQDTEVIPAKVVTQVSFEERV